jgi:DNA-binding beta-propeller fold protein YncE
MVSISADGRTLAVQNGNAILAIDTDSGSIVRTLETAKRYPGTFALSPDGKRVVSSDPTGIFPPAYGSLYVWDHFAAPDARSFGQAMEVGGQGLYEKTDIMVLTEAEASRSH